MIRRRVSPRLLALPIAFLGCLSAAWAQDAVGSGAVGGPVGHASPGSGAAAEGATAEGTASGGTAADLSNAALARPGLGLTPADATRFSGSPLQRGGLGAPLGFVEPPVAEGEPPRPFTIVPSLGIQFLGTDNLFLTPGDRRADFVTSFAPGIFVAADTARLRASLDYAPVAQLYASTPSQNRLDHRFAGQALASLLPGSFYLDLRGTADTRTASGGFTPEGTTVVDRRNRVQTFNAQATPYYVYRFGGAATAQIGYSFGYGKEDGDNAFVPGQAQPFFVAQDYTSHEGFAVVRSGDNFGRLALEGRLSATAFTGSGVLDGAHRAFGSVEGLYAITRNIAALAEVGYEDQSYGGTPGVEISGAIWAVGVRLRPAADSVITARYGRRDGFNSAAVEADVALAPRTTLNAGYADRLTTSTRRDGDLLASSTLDITGRPLARDAGGTPAVSGSQFLAVQGGLLRVKRATIAITRSGPRDSVTLSAFREEQEPVSFVQGMTGFSQRGTSGSISYARELTPLMTGVGYLQYGTFSSPTFGSGSVATASVSLVRRLTERLAGSVQYAITRRDSDNERGDAIQNLVLVSLRQNF